MLLIVFNTFTFYFRITKTEIQLLDKAKQS